jgi:hypothetical protein
MHDDTESQAKRRSARRAMFAQGHFVLYTETYQAAIPILIDC